MRIKEIERTKAFSATIFAALLLATPGCLVRKVAHIHPPDQNPPQEATLAQLVDKINAWSAGINTMTATVDLTPTAGSVYTGALTEYHDVKGFVLLQRPSNIHLLGQAPLIRTTIFDMVSNGEEFRLSIPSKHKFIIGKNTFHRGATKNALENLRPQHISEALLVPPIDEEHEMASYRVENQSRRERKRYYTVFIEDTTPGHHNSLSRFVWFDRSDLEIARIQFYEPDGSYAEDVRYSYYQDFQGVHYPTHIEITRPAEDYELAITVETAKFNDPISPDKFELKQPEGSELVDLTTAKPEERPVGQ